MQRPRSGLLYLFDRVQLYFLYHAYTGIQTNFTMFMSISHIATKYILYLVISIIRVGYNTSHILELI